MKGCYLDSTPFILLAMPSKIDIVNKRYNQNKIVSERLYAIIDIFKQQFGEEYVDVTNSPFIPLRIPERTVRESLNKYNDAAFFKDIIIRIPKETVTNELGLSTVIYDLFVKISFTRSGRMVWGISYKKSTFTEAQLFSKYIHSHCPRLCYDNTEAWNGVCTGSGPINNSMHLLGDENTPLQVYYGFISELRQIIRVESIEGGPYIRMESIMSPHTPVKSVVAKSAKGLFNIRNSNPKHLKALLKSYILSNYMKFGFINKKFCLGTTFVEWLIEFTEYAKAWGEANNVPIIDTSVILKDNKLYVPDPNISQAELKRTENLINKPVITFRETEYKIRIIDDSSSKQVRKLIAPEIGATILNSILNTLNNWYGKISDNTTNVSYL